VAKRHNHLRHLRGADCLNTGGFFMYIEYRCQKQLLLLTTLAASVS
jgi:hypothetical protein